MKFLSKIKPPVFFVKPGMKFIFLIFAERVPLFNRWKSSAQDSAVKYSTFTIWTFKLNAFLQKIKIPQIEKFSFLYNRNFKASCCPESLEILEEKKLPSELEKINSEMKTEILSLLKNYESLKPEFKKFSNEILKNGNLAENLLNLLETKIPR